MIYLIIGPSCAGKSSFVKNSFLKGKAKMEFRDMMPITETDDCFLVGRFGSENRTVGTDRVSRADIPKFFEQTKKLHDLGKDVVLEGDKICSRKFFSELVKSGMKCQLYWIRCKPETSIKRNKANGSTCSDSHLRAVAKKAENLFYDFCHVFNGQVFDTDNITDFGSFGIGTAEPANIKGEIRKDFAVFILSHGRPDNIKTLRTLQKGNYSGPWYIVIDNEDKRAGEYRELYGDHVIMFDKLAVSKTFDTADNFDDRRTVVYARNACFDIAERLGYEYFLELDDDYIGFFIRYMDGGIFKGMEIKNLDRAFNMMVDFLDESGALTVAFAQGGDLIGGLDSANFKKGILRKAMNTFFCKTSNRFNFLGRINEDVNTYVRLGSVGGLFFTFCPVAMVQTLTQSNSGGMTDVYLASGTYLKSFYTVMFCPSCVTVQPMGDKNYRLHHNINWRYAVPKIIREEWRKGSD